MKKTKVLLTGAAGTMGREGLALLAAQPDYFDVVTFDLPTPKNEAILARYHGMSNVSLIWGNITHSDEVATAVNGVDIVLHVAAIIPPAADRNAEIAMKVNFGGTKNLVDAIVASGRAELVKFVYIGSIAQYGNRPVPVHRGRVGDPMYPSIFDHYAVSKIAAERYLIESGIKNWVSLRQTGIMHRGIFDVDDGISYHQPLDNRLEWVTARDAGRVLLQVCNDHLPESFWGQVYNIGGGEGGRQTAYEFLDNFYKMVGLNFKYLEQPNWYALRNFHGMWYLDSDKLENQLHFRTETVADVLAEIRKNLPPLLRLVKLMHPAFIKEFVMKPRANRPNTPLYWIKHQMHERVNAFFGSLEAWHGIKGWQDIDLRHDAPHIVLDHGYDESKADNLLMLPDLQRAAAFRGGQCLSSEMTTGDWRGKLEWVCSEGHRFLASPFLILKAGHWCDACVSAHWASDDVAGRNPFLTQIAFAGKNDKRQRI